jgi:hypothetical protein
MKLPELLIELVKANFVAEPSTKYDDLTVTGLKRESDNAEVNIISLPSENVWNVSLFPDSNIQIAKVIRNKDFLSHTEIAAALIELSIQVKEAQTHHKHFYRQPEHCTCMGSTYCKMICEGGLAICALCGHYEGSLTTDCPGIYTYANYGDPVYAGTIDFRNGAWIEGVSSPHTPAHYRQQ